MKLKRNVYQYGGLVFSSRLKAHKQLCLDLGKDENNYLPYKESLKHDGIYIYYPNNNFIVKRQIL